MGSSSYASDPRVRARHLQAWLELIDREPEPWRTRFHAAVEPAERRLIVDALPTTWLPAGLHAKLADHTLTALGAARAHDYYRRSMLPSLRGPVFAPLLRTGMKLLGTSPAVFIRWAPKAWDASFRDAGRLRGESLGKGVGRIVYEQIHPVLMASDAWCDSATGSGYGVLDVIGVTGVVRLDKSARAEGTMVLDIEWNER